MMENPTTYTGWKVLAEREREREKKSKSKNRFNRILLRGLNPCFVNGLIAHFFRERFFEEKDKPVFEHLSKSYSLEDLIGIFIFVPITVS